MCERARRQEAALLLMLTLPPEAAARSPRRLVACGSCVDKRRAAPEGYIAASGAEVEQSHSTLVKSWCNSGCSREQAFTSSTRGCCSYICREPLAAAAGSAAYPPPPPQTWRPQWRSSYSQARHSAAPHSRAVGAILGTHRAALCARRHAAPVATRAAASVYKRRSQRRRLV